MPADILRPASSTFFLSEDSGLRRKPLRPEVSRPQRFLEAFEDRALYYDCFRDATGADILLVGPPPLNLEAELNRARFSDAQTGTPLQAQHHISRSSLLTRLTTGPATTSVRMDIAGQSGELLVQPNLSRDLKDARFLVGMNWNNDLNWIRDWVEWHIRVHATDTLILFDNGSNAYSLDALAENLVQVAGLQKLVLFDWPHRFGARDSQVPTHHYWAHFLQISALNLALKRCAASGAGFLNCDIDELAGPVSGDAYALAENSPHGIAALAGQWVESVVPEGMPANRHRDFAYTLRGGLSRLCPKKWVLDPARSWAQADTTFPYWHRVMGAPDRQQTEKPVANYFHFRGISTNWKERRRNLSVPIPILHRKDRGLAQALKNVWPE
ncbi:MAG: hypothetical protein KDJ19_07935 [Hyphomicrobiaceae bacterium]|nr:hypothetical protein [Hyphomicrobiaceae bacterium]